MRALNLVLDFLVGSEGCGEIDCQLFSLKGWSWKGQGRSIGG